MRIFRITNHFFYDEAHNQINVLVLHNQQKALECPVRMWIQILMNSSGMEDSDMTKSHTYDTNSLFALKLMKMYWNGSDVHKYDMNIIIQIHMDDIWQPTIPLQYFFGKLRF